MKTFFDLKQEIVAKGLCHGCGGCATFCTAINYGALIMGDDHIPRYKSVEQCIDCGLCYLICPATGELEEQIRRNVGWSAPAGRILQTFVTQATDEKIRERGTDGGVVTAMLLHLFENGRIDGAIVTKETSEGRIPFLAVSREDIINAAGSHFDTIQNPVQLGKEYSTYSPSSQALGALMRQGLKRIAFIGTPCQIKAVRKMEALRLIPSDSIKYYFGLFCTSNFDFGDDRLKTLETLTGCSVDDVDKMNIKDEFKLHLKDGRIISVPLNKLDFAKRGACGFCEDFSAEYADISFGGLGADDGWTTVITRSPVGRAALAEARENCLGIQSIDDNPGHDERIISQVLASSILKKSKAANNRDSSGI